MNFMHCQQMNNRFSSRMSRKAFTVNCYSMDSRVSKKEPAIRSHGATIIRARRRVYVSPSVPSPAWPRGWRWTMRLGVLRPPAHADSGHYLPEIGLTAGGWCHKKNPSIRL